MEGVGDKYHSFTSLRERSDGTVEECFPDMGVNYVMKVSNEVRTSMLYTYLQRAGRPL